MLTRTQDEIVARIEERKEQDFFGFEVGDLVQYLDFEHAKPYLKDEATPEKWEQHRETKDPIDCIKDYMNFAWEKANECRGLSANRSICHMTAWLWLAGEDALVEWVDDERNYRYYGKPALERICDHYAIDWHALDNGIRTNNG